MFPFKKGLWSLFLDRFQLPEGCRPTTWRQLLLTTESPVNPGAHLIDLGSIEGSLSWIGKPQRFLRNVLGSFFSFQLSGPTKLIFKRDQQINLGINGNTPHDMMKFHNFRKSGKVNISRTEYQSLQTLRKIEEVTLETLNFFVFNVFCKHIKIVN